MDVQPRQRRRENAAAVDALELTGVEEVLDIGFGGGASFGHLFQALSDGIVVGIDPTREMVERARREWSRQIDAGRLEIAEGSAEDIPAPDGRFHAALAVNTVYFWPDVDDGFAEVSRVLADDGRFVMAVASPELLENLGFANVGHRVQPPSFYAERLTEHGFEASVVLLDIKKPMSLVVARK